MATTYYNLVMTDWQINNGFNGIEQSLPHSSPMLSGVAVPNTTQVAAGSGILDLSPLCALPPPMTDSVVAATLTDGSEVESKTDMLTFSAVTEQEIRYTFGR